MSHFLLILLLASVVLSVIHSTRASKGSGKRGPKTARKAPGGRKTRRSTVHVYVYEGRPLSGIANGQEFEVTVLSGRRQMKSAYTGTSWSGPGAVLYRGKPIGFVAENGRGRRLVARAQANGGSVGARAIRHRMDPGGWPVVSIVLG